MSLTFGLIHQLVQAMRITLPPRIAVRAIRGRGETSPPRREGRQGLNLGQIPSADLAVFAAWRFLSSPAPTSPTKTPCQPTKQCLL